MAEMNLEVDQMLNALTEKMNINVTQTNVQNKFAGFMKTVKVGASSEDDAKERLLSAVEKDTEEEEEEKLKDAPPLSDDPKEIDNALQNISELHPISSTPLVKLFPWGCCCLRILQSFGAAPDRGYTEVQGEEDKKVDKILSEYINKLSDQKYEGTNYLEDQRKVHEDSLQTDDDPFEDFGFGVIAYFKLMRYLIYIYIFVSGIAGYMMYKYSFGNALEGSGNNAIIQYALGNYGFTGYYCDIFYNGLLSSESHNITCSGERTISEITYYGLIADQEEIYHSGQNGDDKTAGNDFCGNHENIFLASDHDAHAIDCSNDILKEDLHLYWNSNCLGNKACTINYKDYISAAQDEKSECNSNQARFYTQYQCDQPDEMVTERQNDGYKLVGCAMAICVIFNGTLLFLSSQTKKDFKEWDKETVTPADYTLELDITPSMYEKFIESRKKGVKGSFDSQIRKIMLEQLNKPGFHIFKRSQDVKVEITQIAYGYKNGELIKMLKQRGNLIGNLKPHKKLENEIQKYVIQNFEEISTPVKAFITFRTQEGVERCKKYTKTAKNPQQMIIFGEKARFKEAPEPSNIIWENLETTGKTMTKRKCLVDMTILTFVCITFVTFVALKATSGKTKMQYPISVDCEEIENQILNSPNTAEGDMDMDVYREFAEKDKAYAKQFLSSGMYQCYCKNPNKDSESDLCDQYFSDMNTATGLSTLVSILITVINIVTRTINIKLIDYVGQDYGSEQVKSIMLSIFITSFINTGIILLFVNADLKYSILSFIPLNGQYADFDRNWYLDIAPSIVQTMCIAAFQPYIDITTQVVTKLLSRFSDSGCYCCRASSAPKVTKKKTADQYIKLYGGPIFLMHFKYSSIMVQVFVSFLYGMFIPALFPIALFGIFNMYVVERITLAWFYRQPPSYDGKLNDAAINVLKFAPVGMFTVGYWALGNRQIFFDQAKEVQHANQVNDPGHDLIYWDDLTSHTGIILILLAFVVVANILSLIIKKCREAYAQEPDEPEDEGIAPYWNSLTGEVQKKFFANEVFLQKTLAFKTLDQGSFDRLRTSKREIGKEYITGLPNYDILRNLIYQDEFEYYPIEQCDDPEDLLQNNFVSQIIYIGEHHKMEKDGDSDATEAENSSQSIEISEDQFHTGLNEEK